MNLLLFRFIPMRKNKGFMLSHTSHALLLKQFNAIGWILRAHYKNKQSSRRFYKIYLYMPKKKPESDS
ncbi:hypothetical protein N879_01350 [Alcaligenes sp. EGD-AK7]|nr:hypothetical protein C660_07802 [Alcaligenes sp. HPC1271]ERI34185.1 hypothetical protein N879_01350 [Alcaligenes sp. EGD-AK7]